MQHIAFLGLGIMGSGMANKLLQAGHPLTVWNRDPRACRSLAEKGAHVAPTPAACVREAEVVMYSLSNDQAVWEVLTRPDGVLSGVRAGQTALDMSTVSPETSRRELAAYAEKGVEFLDTPVFGSRHEAAQGGLWVLAGGKREVFEHVRPILETISATLHYMGGTGMGATMKLVGNLIVALQLEAAGEAMVLASKAGLSPEDVLGVLRVTDFRSPVIENTVQALMERNFQTDFSLQNLLKDTNLIDQLAQQFNAPVPAFAQVRETVKAAANEGFEWENASALIKALEQQAGITIERRT
jgi:3-hydroxyisobutyrate dehydrogenase-like beta-hydroxyacid dehydrogenase